jgi:hypothetical protein
MSASRSAAEAAVVPFNQPAWEAWQARGCAADAAIRDRVQATVIIAGAVACLAAGFAILGRL